MLLKNNTLFDKNIIKIISLFFKNPSKSFHLRQLAYESGLSTTSVSNACKKLISNKIIKVAKNDITKEFRANLESDEYFNAKKLFNQFLINSSGLVEEIKKELNPKVVVLFGSYSKGEDIEKSDIDLLAISARKKELDLARYEKLLSRKIHLIMIENFKKSDKEFVNSIINGVVLYGYLEVK
jgi:predicted nucleotidyltransferase